MLVNSVRNIFIWRVNNYYMASRTPKRKVIRTNTYKGPDRRTSDPVMKELRFGLRGGWNRAEAKTGYHIVTSGSTQNPHLFERGAWEQRSKVGGPKGKHFVPKKVNMPKNLVKSGEMVDIHNLSFEQFLGFPIKGALPFEGITQKDLDRAKVQNREKAAQNLYATSIFPDRRWPKRRKPKQAKKKR